MIVGRRKLELGPSGGDCLAALNSAFKGLGQLDKLGLACLELGGLLGMIEVGARSCITIPVVVEEVVGVLFVTLVRKFNAGLCGGSSGWGNCRFTVDVQARDEITGLLAGSMDRISSQIYGDKIEMRTLLT